MMLAVSHRSTAVLNPLSTFVMEVLPWAASGAIGLYLLWVTCIAPEPAQTLTPAGQGAPAVSSLTPAVEDSSVARPTWESRRFPTSQPPINQPPTRCEAAMAWATSDTSRINSAFVRAPAPGRVWRRLKELLCDRYRPERHYMRGPGPKWRQKHSHEGRLGRGA